MDQRPPTGQPARPAQPGSTPTRIKLWKVSHVVLRVADLERSLPFYLETLGMVLRSRLPGAAHLDAGGITLTLLQPPTGAPAPPGNASEVVFETHDVRAAYAWLRSRAVPFTGELRVVSTDHGRDLLAASFRDPDGHLLCITGWTTARQPVAGAPVTPRDLTNR